MAFSFNPSSQQATTPQGGQPTYQPTSIASANIEDTSVPDSPFLFMQLRGKEMTVYAYLQILLIAVALFSILAAIIFFSYGMYLSSSIKTQSEALDAADATFKDYPIDDMKRLSTRMALLSIILKDYLSVRSPLKFLEQVVEKQVYFSDFSLTRAKQSSVYVMDFNVVTTNYRVLIQQLEALNLGQYNKIVPQTKVGNLTDSQTSLKIRITAPINAQGVLPDDVVFIKSSTDSSASSTAP